MDNANVFADYFHEKIEKLKSDITISDNVHNGYNKLMVVDRFFMEEFDIRECMETIKPKYVKGMIEYHWK